MVVRAVTRDVMARLAGTPGEVRVLPSAPHALVLAGGGAGDGNA